MRRPGPNHAGLAREPGCRSREDVALQAQLLVLTPQPGELLPLGRAQRSVGGRRRGALAPLAAIRRSNPVPDRLRGRLELTRQFLGRAPGPDQLDDLTPELRRIGRTGFGHIWTLNRTGFPGGSNS